MNTRVRIPLHYLGRVATGTVIGVASATIIFSYIVLLDESVSTEYGEVRALTVSGSELESEDGTSNWRLDRPLLGKDLELAESAAFKELFKQLKDHHSKFSG